MHRPCPTKRSSEREPADSLGDKSNVIGGWLPSLTLALGKAARAMQMPTTLQPSLNWTRKSDMNTPLLTLATCLGLSCAASAQTYTAKIFTSAEYVLVDISPRDGVPDFDYVPGYYTPVGISDVDGSESRAFYEFDLTSFPTTLSNATFALPCVSYRIGSYCDAYAYQGTNGPDLARWNVAVGGAFVSRALLGAGPYIPLPYGGAILTEFDATEAIRAARAAGWNYIGFGVIAGPASVTEQGGFIASLYTPELDADRPLISVTAPAPLLSITRSDQNVILSWAAPPSSFILEEQVNLGSTNWQELQVAPALTNSQNQVFIQPALGQTFYRLRSR
jgi:hypothetical protein